MTATGAQTKAFFKPERGQPIPCMFNPSGFSVSRSNKWEMTPRPGRGLGQLTYQGSSNGDMSVDVFFDTTDTGRPVTEHTDKLMKLMDEDPSLPGADPASGKGRPQTVVFSWGNLQSFEAVVTHLNVELKYFSATGVPLRATAKVTLKQYEAEYSFPPQNPTSGTRLPHTAHRVSPGETLDRIAARHYADPNAWRIIAEANHIDDPLALRPGTLLAIPGQAS
ncbi:LysM peptidoglycan-binding domain-containing protein [Kineosporia sp. J2-2]|uniref:LysM peptidoglycan-binding domain-containing protein n=1 Tax=Kineosporia corallincola TaxID=2835133 RepID=A0ABS5TAW4_9ACTN|nr:LysM peptidoglycan-binding domain-containing protein [Kineosporia corallincola]MBT0768213.1 LysM peptidoglycan-binding domain-containing protein [Kineosporia corallincola]